MKNGDFLNASLIKYHLKIEDEYNNRLNAVRDGESISNKRLTRSIPLLINSNIEFLNEDTGFNMGYFIMSKEEH